MKNFKNIVRIFFVLLLLTLMTLSLSASCFASSVSYQGEAEGFIFSPGSDSSPTDLFESLKGVMPGDVLTEQISVDNDASGEVKVKLYMRAVGAGGDEEFLSKLNLKAEQEGEAVLFEAPAREAVELKEWMYLGTFYSGGRAVLNLTLEVPIELDDRYQNAMGSMKWEFKAEEFPAEDTDPKLPETGDVLNMGLWTVIGIGALMIVLCILVRVRRRKE